MLRNYGSAIATYYNNVPLFLICIVFNTLFINEKKEAIYEHGMRWGRRLLNYKKKRKNTCLIIDHKKKNSNKMG